MWHTIIEAEVAFAAGMAAVRDGALQSLSIDIRNIDGEVMFLEFVEVRKSGCPDKFAFVQAFLNLFVEGFEADCLILLEFLVKIDASPMRCRVIVDKFPKLPVLYQKVNEVTVLLLIPCNTVVQHLLHEKIRFQFNLGVPTHLAIPASLGMVQMGFVRGLF